MKVLSVAPKDVYVTFEMPLTEVLMLQKALNLAEVSYSGDKKEERDAVQFLTEGFCPVINKLILDLRGEYDT